MRRRDFGRLIGCSGAAVLMLRVARAQEVSNRKRLIGIVSPYADNDTEYRAHVDALRAELQKLGWREGANIHFDERWTTDDMDRIRSNSAELVAAHPDALVAVGGRVVPILMKLTSSIPIVVPGSGDPVGAGWVQSLARPGGNVTGFGAFELSVLGKMLEVLTQIAPATRRVAILYNPANPSAKAYRATFEKAAPRLGLEPMVGAVQDLAAVDAALSTLSQQPATGIFIAPDITLQALREDVVRLIAQNRLPAIYPQAAYVRSGGLACYGADRIDLWRRAAEYVDRILRGEKAGDLPFQQPTKYQLIINLKTARTLGLDVPLGLQARADEVIE